MMNFVESFIAGVFTIKPEPFTDERGWFSRMFCKQEFREVGLDIEFVQLNQSFNRVKGTFRGMHFQLPPFAEKKLVRCVAGGVTDFVVDLRMNSPTFMKTMTVDLTAENMNMILIPEGIAHGFITLQDNTSLLYHHTAFHHPPSEGGIRYDDPQLSIELPVPIEVISLRDRSYELLGQNFNGIKI